MAELIEALIQILRAFIHFRYTFIGIIAGSLFLGLLELMGFAISRDTLIITVAALAGTGFICDLIREFRG